jgi:hypothetical protein
MPRDLITLEMRIQEDVRHILKAMFISSEEKKHLLEEALESAIVSVDIHQHIKKQASQAVLDAVNEYFTYGEGGMILKKSINDALHETIPNIFNNRE